MAIKIVLQQKYLGNTALLIQVGKNNIGTPKIQNYICWTIKFFISSILRLSTFYYRASKGY